MAYEYKSFKNKSKKPHSRLTVEASKKVHALLFTQGKMSFADIVKSLPEYSKGILECAITRLSFSSTLYEEKDQGKSTIFGVIDGNVLEE